MQQALPSISRRGFLRTGLLGSAALATVSTTALLSGCSQVPLSGMKLLRAADIAFLKALIPAVLVKALPDEVAAREAAISKIISGIDVAVYSTSVAGRKQLLQLFDLLTFAPTRFMLAGMSHDWKESSVGDVEAFLVKWQHSSVKLFNAGYSSLVQIIEMQWYMQPESWAAVGYVQPKKIVDA